jgi:hypothetical protein
MTALHTLAVVAVAVTAVSIAIYMVEDVLAEIDRRRRDEELISKARRRYRMRQRHS